MEKLTLADSTLSNKQKEIILAIQNHPDGTRAEIAKMCRVSTTTVYRALKAWKEFQSSPVSPYTNLLGERCPPPTGQAHAERNRPVQAG